MDGVKSSQVLQQEVNCIRATVNRGIESFLFVGIITSNVNGTTANINSVPTSHATARKPGADGARAAATQRCRKNSEELNTA